eukprot:ANDGO_06594.mRNA.1 Sarcosine/dimethylglycine N-methyltransferase
MSVSSADKARDYYNSADADNFYHAIWGGTDIHIGIYTGSTNAEMLAKTVSDDLSGASFEETIHGASRRTVREMASLIPPCLLDAESKRGNKVLDIGAGYGGASRYLASVHSVPVVCLNLAAAQNTRNQEMNYAENLHSLVTVVEGNFESLPFPDASFSVVWSQDAILHSDKKEKVFSEVSRVLRPGGVFVFSDIVATDHADEDRLKPLLQRIHLSQFGSDSTYKRIALDVGLEWKQTRPLPQNAQMHYARVRQELRSRKAANQLDISDEYALGMDKGLTLWVKGFADGHVSWGFWHFQKPS